MRRVRCPHCGSDKLYHYTDAYVVRNPIISDTGEIELSYSHKDEFDENFFECRDCGHQPTESEILTELSA